MSDIILVSMPFAPVPWPSLGVGQLVASARRAGMTANSTYPCIRFAEIIGFPMYSIFFSGIQPDSLLAEWFFSGIAFEGYDFPNDKFPSYYFNNDEVFQGYLLELKRRNKGLDIEDFIKLAEVIRGKARKFVLDTANEIVERRPRIVGATTTFMQYTSSLALLRRIKDIDPEIITMLGGANCEGEMGYITKKQFGWVDFVVSGEADIVFPELCKKILDTGPDLEAAETPYGVYSRQKVSAIEKGSNETAVVQSMDDVPIPDYSSYFLELEKSGIRKNFTPMLVMESSRGCWKGHKNPCNFCGLNGIRFLHRVKSPERVIEEFDVLSSRYGVSVFFMTDTLLPSGYFDTLFTELINIGAPYKICYETLSTLNENQVKQLSDAGVCWIQAGVESLHDELISALNKGNSAIHSIALLKFAFENGIRMVWHLLNRIPGEKESHYSDMCKFLPLLYHLPAPGTGKIRFDRFSTYHREPQKFALELQSLPAYRYVYPFKEEDMERMAYFFRQKNGGENTVPAGFKDFEKIVREWQMIFSNRNKRPRLEIYETNGQITIIDTRHCAVAENHILSETETAVCNATRVPVTKKTLVKEFYNKITEDEIESAVESLTKKKLVLKIRNRFLSLPVYPPRKKTREIFTRHNFFDVFS